MEVLETMTAEEKYNYLLLKLSEKLKEQDDTIILQKRQINELEKKLAEANKENNVIMLKQALSEVRELKSGLSKKGKGSFYERC